MYNGNENVVICDHPLIKHKITRLRDKSTGTNEFRAIVEEIAMLIGYEALRDLETEEVDIETPLEVAKCPVIAGKKQAIVPMGKRRNPLELFLKTGRRLNEKRSGVLRVRSAAVYRVCHCGGR